MSALSDRGFSLVEVLVALLVLSVGLLGIAALHAHALAAQRSALLRTYAVNLAGDMAERIRANRSGGADDRETGVETVDCDAQSASVRCTPAELAAHDRAAWERALAELLPGGTGRIERDAATEPPTYTISVNWTEPGAEPLAERLVTQVAEH